MPSRGQNGGRLIGDFSLSWSFHPTLKFFLPTPLMLTYRKMPYGLMFTIGCLLPMQQTFCSKTQLFELLTCGTNGMLKLGILEKYD